MPPPYCIDSSALIHAWRDLYRPASFPSFWTRMDGLIEAGHLIAPEEVRQELLGPEDLVAWAGGRDPMFRELDEPFQRAVRDVLQDLDGLMRHRALRYVSGDLKADPFVVALARLTTATVVTQERPRGPQGRPKIPDLCRRHRLPFVPLADFIEEVRWRF